MQKTRYKIW